MPGRSRVGSAPMPPPYEIMPFVGTNVTTPLCVPGLRHEPPVDSQIEHVTRFAATEAPEPPLEPPVSRVESYGLQVGPPQVSRAPVAPSIGCSTFASPPGLPLPPLYSALCALA